jgi:hypothetical protein
MGSPSSVGETTDSRRTLFWPQRSVEHNAHNLKIAGYTASEHKRASATADP